jgi:hypothetical protein
MDARLAFCQLSGHLLCLVADFVNFIIGNVPALLKACNEIFINYLHIWYRDSYFVIEGLLYSELNDVAKGMIENFLDFVETYGFLRM